MVVQLAERKDVQTVVVWVVKKLVLMAVLWVRQEAESMDQKTADWLAAWMGYKSASYWVASLGNAMAAMMELRTVGSWVDSLVEGKVHE